MGAAFFGCHIFETMTSLPRLHQLGKLYSSLHLLMPNSRIRPPLPVCFGAKLSQAAKYVLCTITQ
jgi:hypothetical protein